VAVNNPTPVQGQRRVGGDSRLVVEIADAAERSGGGLMLLLELGAVAADKGPAAEKSIQLFKELVPPSNICSGVIAGGALVSAAARPRRRRKDQAARPNTTGLVPFGMRAVISLAWVVW